MLSQACHEDPVVVELSQNLLGSLQNSSDSDSRLLAWIYKLLSQGWRQKWSSSYGLQEQALSLLLAPSTYFKQKKVMFCSCPCALQTVQSISSAPALPPSPLLPSFSFLTRMQRPLRKNRQSGKHSSAMQLLDCQSRDIARDCQ